jgi:hypothetical protein
MIPFGSQKSAIWALKNSRNIDFYSIGLGDALTPLPNPNFKMLFFDVPYTFCCLQRVKTMSISRFM